MSEIFVAVSMVTRSRICGCSSKPRRDCYKVLAVWTRYLNNLSWEFLQICNFVKLGHHVVSVTYKF